MRIRILATVVAVTSAALAAAPAASATAPVTATNAATPMSVGTVTSRAAVTPVVTRVPIDLASTAAGAPNRVLAAMESAPVDVEHVAAEPFSTIGFSYDAGSGTPQIEVKVRENGTWSDWQALDPTDAGPDAGTSEAARSANRITTEPLMADAADAFEVRVTPTVAAAMPTGFSAVTIDPGSSPADAQLQASAAANVPAAAPGEIPGLAYPAPAIISRAAWGADENLRINQNCDPVGYNSTIKVGFVHHTASTNNYDQAGAAAEVRGMYAYHVLVNGWCDFGYNFVVDKFGRVYEGRWGGVDRPVIGAHTGGFNRDSFGVSALGNYDIAQPSNAMLSSIARVLGWKLGLHNRNPLGQDVLVSAGGGTDKWPVGQAVVFNVVSGHRDAGSTVCPGRFLYPQLGQIRGMANAVALQTNTVITGATPAVQQVHYAGSPALFTANVPSAQPWTLTYVEEATGIAVRHVSGYTEPGQFPGVWDLTTDARGWARGGMYTWSLKTAAGGFASGRIEVIPPVERASASRFTGSITDDQFEPISPTRVYDSRNGGTQPLGPGNSRNIRVRGGSTGIPSGAGGVALNVTAVDATQPGFLSVYPAGSTRPQTSSLNFAAGETVPGMVIAPVGSDNSVTLYNNAGSAHVVVDVIGYFTGGSAGTYKTAVPTRVLDGSASPMVNGEVRAIDVAGRLGVPSGQLAGTVVNVTISGASAPGNVVVYPAGIDVPTASSANVVMGRDVTNRSVVANLTGGIAVRNIGGTARVFIDVVGYFTRDGSGAHYSSVTPTRILDTRYGPGERAPLGAAATLALGIAGTAGVPSGATAVFGTVTSDRTTEPTHLRVWATGGALPGTSDLNPWPGVAAANADFLPVGADRSTTIYNNSGSTAVIVDIAGYFS